MRENYDNHEIGIVQRVAILEANALNTAKTLEKVVLDLGTIVLSLAERKGVEKVVFALCGCIFTLVGWGLEHISRLRWPL